MTIDELGTMVKEGFDYVDKRFDRLEHEVHEITNRLDGAAQRYELLELERRVDTIEHKVGLQP